MSPVSRPRPTRSWSANNGVVTFGRRKLIDNHMFTAYPMWGFGHGIMLNRLIINRIMSPVLFLGGVISHLGYNSFFPIFAAALTIFADAMPWWWNGRHEGLKIPWPETAVRVRVPPGAQGQLIDFQLVGLVHIFRTASGSSPNNQTKSRQTTKRQHPRLRKASFLGLKFFGKASFLCLIFHGKAYLCHVNDVILC